MLYLESGRGAIDRPRDTIIPYTLKGHFIMRTAVFVDDRLLFALSRLNGVYAGWLDASKLVNYVMEGDEPISAYYYVVSPAPVSSDRAAYAFRRKVQESSKVAHVRIGSPYLVGMNTDGRDRYMTTTNDVRMTLDVVDAINKGAERIIMITNNVELAPIVEYAKTHGVEVVLYHHPDRAPRPLTNAADVAIPMDSIIVNAVRGQANVRSNDDAIVGYVEADPNYAEAVTA